MHSSRSTSCPRSVLINHAPSYTRLWIQRAPPRPIVVQHVVLNMLKSSPNCRLILPLSAGSSCATQGMDAGDRRPKSKVKRGTYIQDKRDTGITGVAAEMISLAGLRSRHHPRPTRPLSLSQLLVYTTAHGHTARHTARHSSTQARRPRRAKRISSKGYHTEVKQTRIHDTKNMRRPSHGHSKATKA